MPSAAAASAASTRAALPEDADPHAGSRGSGCASTSAVRASRHGAAAHASRGARATRSPPRACPRSAPPVRRWPSVPTGTPPGICTIDSSESSPFSALTHRHAEDRHHRVRRDHAGQVGGAAGAGDDHLDAAGLGARRELLQEHRSAVSGDDLHLVGDRRARRAPLPRLHGRPVGARPHDDGDEGLGHLSRGRARSPRLRARRPARPRPTRTMRPLHEDVHAVGAQLVQQAVVVGDGQHAEAVLVRRRLDAAGAGAQGVDVEAGVELVEDGDRGCEHRRAAASRCASSRRRTGRR